MTNVEDSMILPSYVNDNDLLGGELFGDELIDMYITPEDIIGEASSSITLPYDASSNPEVTKPPSPPQTTPVIQTPAPSPKTVTDMYALSTLPKQVSMTSLETGEGRKRGFDRMTQNHNQTFDMEPQQKMTKTSSAPSLRSPNLTTGPSPLTLKLLNQTSQAGNTPNPLISRIKHTTPSSTIPSPLTKPMVNNALADVQAAQNAAIEEQKTEAHFNAIAQAAVSNLIATGQSNAISLSPVDDGTPKPTPDISTAHIAALTSPTYLSTAHNDDSIGQAAPKRRCQNLTPDERVRQNRERNKRHARNTRLRKKAYIEELKRTLLELVSQRDSTEMERRQNRQREIEEREVRFRVMEEFLRLRGINERSVSRWVAILEDEFSLTIPITSYRNMVSKNVAEGEINDFDQTLKGATQVMEDANYASAYMSETFSAGSPLSVHYNCERTKFFMDDCNAVLEWTASAQETKFKLKGTMTAKFSPVSNKLESAAIFYDTGVIVAQAKVPSPKNVVKEEYSPENTCSGSVISKDDENEQAEIYPDPLRDDLIGMAPTPVTSSSEITY